MAASPVIGVILMVGTTVILGASVYTWTSNYSNVPQQGVRVLALSSEGPVVENDKWLVVSAVMPGVDYGDLNLTLEGRHLSQTTAPECAKPPRGQYVACRGGETLRAGDAITAGDHVRLHAEKSDMLRVVDAHAGFVVLTLTID